jgi:RNA polymerase sigma factor (sigma-70 family)
VVFPKRVASSFAAEPVARPAGIATLAELTALGDLRARDALWARCSVFAKQVARRCGGSTADIDDLSQEALLCAIESYSSLRDSAALLSWLRVVVTRSVSHHLRKMRRQGPLLAGGADPEVLPAHDALPDFQVELRRFLATLGSLPEEQRSCLWLRRAEGLRIDEIARETTLSRSTIQRRLRIAEQRLAKRLPSRPASTP